MIRHILRYLRIPYLALLALTTAGLLIAHVWLFLTDWQDQAVALSNAQAENREVTAQLRDLRSRQALAAQVDEARAQLEYLDTLISHPLDQAHLVSQTNRLVRRATIDVVHGDNDLVEIDDGLLKFRQELTVEGDYAGIRYFLNLIESANYLNLVEEVDWKPHRAGRQKARVKLVTFLQGAGQ